MWQKATQEVKHASLAIAQEFDRSANDWLSCFGSVLFRLEIYLSEAYRDRELSARQYRQCQEKLEITKRALSETRPLYPSKYPLPPTEIQRRLLGLLRDVVEVP